MSNSDYIPGSETDKVLKDIRWREELLRKAILRDELARTLNNKKKTKEPV